MKMQVKSIRTINDVRPPHELATSGSALARRMGELLNISNWWRILCTRLNIDSILDLMGVFIQQHTLSLYYRIVRIDSPMLQRCKKNVLKQFQNIRCLPKNSQAKNCVLILDTVTAPMLSELVSLQQLLEIGIKDLGRVDKIKKPQPAAIAIYYISSKSLQFLYKDFQSTAQTKSKRKSKNKNAEMEDEHSQRNAREVEQQQKSLYFSINILLCEQVTQKLMRQIALQEEVIERLASFGQLHIPCKYSSNSIGLIQFSRSNFDNVEIVRRQSRAAVTKKQDEEKSEMSVKRKRQHTAHHIHKDNLSCLPDIYAYQFSTEKKSKSKIDQIQQNLNLYGQKLCESIVAGVNFGLNTVVKIVCYESKFSQKIKQVFTSSLIQYMQTKSKQQIQAQLEQTSNGGKSSLFFQQSDEPQAKQMIVVIADRSADYLSPLVRSLLYEPLLMDVFEIKDYPDRKIKIISKKIPPTMIQTDDKIFCQYKNLHIYKVFQTIDDNFKTYLTTNKAAQFHKQTSAKKPKYQGMQFQMQQKPNKSAKQLREVIKQLPQHQKTIKNYQTNIDILNAILSIMKQKKLQQQAQLEHMIVTGYTFENKQEKDKKILQKLLIVLGDPNMNVEDRCRLLVLSVCFLDISNEDRNKLIKRLSEIQGHGDIAMGLSKISSKGTKKYSVHSNAIKYVKQSPTDRHQSTLSTVMQQLITCSSNSMPKLPKAFKMEQVKALGTIKKPVLKGSISRQKQKNIEYVISMSGGMGYNEMADIGRIARLANQPNVQVNFLTDYIFAPNMYLAELCTML